MATANSDCMRTAADHEATVAARTEELKVIAKAKKILQESTGAAEKQSYSLLQVLNFMSCLSTWKITNIVKIYRKCDIRQKNIEH